jgi:hypothetical protein
MTDVTLLPPRNIVPFRSKRRPPAAPPTMEPVMSATTPAHPDQKLLDLCARADELERASAAACAQVTAAGCTGIEEEDKLEEKLGIPDIEEKLSDLNKAIVTVRPTTLAGFVAKAKRAHKARLGDERPPDEYMDGMLVTSLITDLVATEA